MSKFKVGDRVRRVRNPIEGCASLGYEAEVLDRSSDYCLWYVSENSQKVNGQAEDWELVSPASPSPVRTKTVKEIVPGAYGVINVFDDGRVDAHCRDASELREAARIFIEIADALEA